MNDTMFSIRIPMGLLNKYRKFCIDNGFSISGRVRKFMENDMETWDKKLKIHQEKIENRRKNQWSPPPSSE